MKTISKLIFATLLVVTFSCTQDSAVLDSDTNHEEVSADLLSKIHITDEDGNNLMDEATIEVLSKSELDQRIENLEIIELKEGINESSIQSKSCNYYYKRTRLQGGSPYHYNYRWHSASTGHLAKVSIWVKINGSYYFLSVPCAPRCMTIGRNIATPWPQYTLGLSLCL